MKKWFKNVTTIEELRSEYKELLKKHYPDNGSNLHIMQEINAEYEIIFATLVWCFNCYAYKDSLKALDFKSKKHVWTWHYGEYSCYHKGEISIDDIRYG